MSDVRGADNIGLDNIVYYTDPKMRTMIVSRLNVNRFDCLLQAEEFAQFAQSTELGGRDVLNVVSQSRKKLTKSRSVLKIKVHKGVIDVVTYNRSGQLIGVRDPELRRVFEGAVFPAQIEVSDLHLIQVWHKDSLGRRKMLRHRFITIW